MCPQLVLGRLDAMVKRVLPVVRDLAAEMGLRWPSPVYAEIVAVIERQVSAMVS